MEEQPTEGIGDLNSVAARKFGELVTACSDLPEEWRAAAQELVADGLRTDTAPFEKLLLGADENAVDEAGQS
jgi:hypothetical protein